MGIGNWARGLRCGANEWTRTTDRLFTKQLLCRLSYVGSYAICETSRVRGNVHARECARQEWSQRVDSNHRPAVYETAALPTELRWHVGSLFYSTTNAAVFQTEFWRVVLATARFSARRAPMGYNLCCDRRNAGRRSRTIGVREQRHIFGGRRKWARAAML